MDWFEDDQFWINFGPVMFNANRWQDTPWEVENLLRLTGTAPEASVLDSCCGVGRHAIEFARRGFKVTAVDRTAGYIEAAAETAATEELTIEFITADVRDFVRNNSYDLALNMFTSFGFFSSPAEERQYISNIRDSLTTGGIFVIDLNGKEILARDFKAEEEYELDGSTIRGEYRIENDFSTLFNHWSIAGGGKEYSFKFAHRIYSAVELKQLLFECGYTSVDVYGGFDGRPYDNKAQRLITVAHK